MRRKQPEKDEKEKEFQIINVLSEKIPAQRSIWIICNQST